MKKLILEDDGHRKMEENLSSRDADFESRELIIHQIHFTPNKDESLQFICQYKR